MQKGRGAAVLKLVLRDDDEDLGDGTAGEGAARTVDLHGELELDVLGSLEAARHHEDGLRGERSAQSEAGFRGADDVGRGARLDEGDAEPHRRARQVVRAAHREELDLARARRDRVHGYDGDVVEGVVGRPLEARRVVHRAEVALAHASAVD